MSESPLNNKQNRDRIGIILTALYLLLLAGSVLIVGKIGYIQLFWKPNPKIEKALTPSRQDRTIEPIRGNIIDCNGRLLAMSYPVYDLHMDCTVRLDEFAKMRDRKLAAQKEEAWLLEASRLSDALAGIFPGKTADQYYEIIRNGRSKGRRYVPIALRVDRSTMLKVKDFPLFKEGANKGGLIVEQRFVRKYPYGRLARRTIGFVRDNSSNVAKTHIGLEGKFDAVLHGTDGRECLRVTDYGRVRDFDSTYVKAVDGEDLRTTINIDFQELADRALRAEIDSLEDIEGACLVLMEVKSGAIRAMVNLQRNPAAGNGFEEIINHAIGRKCEPGSVFKTVTLLTAVDDGYVKSLDETMPTNHGWVSGTGLRQDIHILDWERENKTKEISIYDGFKISSNYVLSSIAVNNYRNRTRHFIEKIYSYGLGDSFEFDLDGLVTPTIPRVPEKRELNATTLGSVGFGYSTEETPLHILTFYNAIANKGCMMKPYLVEDIEKGGIVKDSRGKSKLNSSICSKAAADTVTRALVAVTEEGTARRLKNAKCTVAGKTGTSFATFENGQYSDREGRHKYQGTFVGFFPAEDPQYSIVCCVYSRPTRRQYQGGGIPARTVRTVVDHLVDTQPYWQGSVEKGGSAPRMASSVTLPQRNGELETAVPSFSGLGLKDALWLAENAGFKCRYSGDGQVARQAPAAGVKAKKGSTIEIVLK